MFYERFHVTFVGVVATLVDSVVVANLPATGCTGFCIATSSQPSAGHLIHHFLSMAPASHARRKLLRRDG